MRTRASITAAACCALAWFGCRLSPTNSIAERQLSRPASASALAAKHECAGCHAREVAEWDASLHRASFTDKDFQASFSIEPEDFCFKCHAPLAKDRADVAGSALGIACVSCHSLARGHAEGRTTVASTAGCGGCHEFTFPHQRDLMQSTMSEHTRSPFADRTCTSCHMPKGADGHRDHRFDVSRNEALLRRSIDVQTRRTTEGIAIDLITKDVGHAMPTGDLFRRMLVVVHAEDATGMPLGEDEVVLGRRFERLGPITRQREDMRVEGRRTVNVDGEWITKAAHVTITVRYERVAQTADMPDVSGGFRRRDRIFAAVTLYETVLEK